MASNNIPAVFNYGSQQVRTITKDGEPWFVAIDVCDVLEVNNVADALAKRVDRDDRANIVLSDTSQRRKYGIINESGLLMLPNRSA